MEEQGKHSGDPPASGTLDIDNILAELAQYSSAQQQSNQAAHIPSVQEQQQWMQPQAAAQRAQNAERSLDPRQIPYHREVATPPAQLSRSPLIDPSTILEWPQALRCVNKLSAQNPSFGPTIKVMISDQARNVQQWWKDREALLNVQAGRKESVRRLNETLKAVGGAPASAPTPEEDKAETDRFDLKVYTATQRMSDHHSAELKRLGVPFFGVSPKFIIMNDIQQVAATRDPLSQATITEAELIDLQRKMIQYLEDLYMD